MKIRSVRRMNFTGITDVENMLSFTNAGSELDGDYVRKEKHMAIKVDK